MNIGLAIDKKNGVKSEVAATGKSGAKETHQNSLNLVNNPFGGEYEIKKARNKWNGWGTCLKPSFEPIIVARKPLDGTCVDNVIKWGVGGINIDECRVGNEVITQLQKDMTKYHGNKLGAGHHTQMTGVTTQTVGRFPANTILTYDETDFKEVCGGFPNTKSSGGIINNPSFKDIAVKQGISKLNFGQVSNAERTGGEYVAPNDSGSASRYYYCAKASKRDRDEGLDKFETKQTTGGGGGIGDYLEDVNSASGKFGSEKAPHKNFHPTVKPTLLMQYLIRLVTPKGGTVLDPFMGSGSTGKAVAFENKERQANYSFIGIERESEYCDIARARIEWACKYEENEPKTLEETEQIKFDIE